MPVAGGAHVKQCAAKLQRTDKKSGDCIRRIADYFALSVPRFAARAWLQINLLCVLGEVISEREADLVHGV